MIVLALLSLISLASMPIFWLCIVFVIRTSGLELEWLELVEAIGLCILVSTPPNHLSGCSLTHVTRCEPSAVPVHPSVSPQLQGEIESLKAMLPAFAVRFGSSGLTSSHSACSNIAQNNPSREGIGVDQPTEFAGAAKTRSTLSPAIVSDFWNADTGATSHMTPRREWFKEYCPCQVLIRVANHEIVRAAGIGSVEFLLIKNGQSLRPIVFTNVLHVPALAENLFSVLTVTRKHKIRILIDETAMSFIRSNRTLFVASVGDNNVALLDGKTKIQAKSLPSQSANATASTTSYEIWHKRLGHIGHDRLSQLSRTWLMHSL